MATNGMALLPVSLALVSSARALTPGAWRLVRPLALACFVAAIDLFFDPLAGSVSTTTRICASSAVFLHAGLLSAAQAKREGAVRACALAIDALCGSALAWLFSHGLRIMDASGAAVRPVDALPWMQAAEGLLIVVPLLWLGAAFFGSMVLVSRRFLSPLQPSYERQLAVRYLTSAHGGVLSRVTAVATLGVALGVWLVLVSVGILSGFESDLFDKLVGTYGHLSVTRVDEMPIEKPAALLHAFADEKQRDVRAFAPYVMAPLAIVSDINYSGGQLLGMDVTQSARVLGALRSLTPQSREVLALDSTALEVVVGAELARNLSVERGDRVRLVVPTEQTLTPLGPVPRSLSVRVAGVLKSEMYEADSHLVLCSLPLARRLLRLAPAAITGVHAMLADASAVDETGERVVRAACGQTNGNIHATSFRARNQTLFAALALERVVAFVVLAFVILVASFSVVNTLTMAIWQRRFEVAILKTMGATTGSILAVFLWQGALVGITGIAMGTALGLVTLSMLSRHGFGIPYEVYYVDALPVHISTGDVVLSVAGSLLVLWTFALLPSQQGAKLLPAEALRHG